MYRVVVGLMTSSSREFPRSESDADDSSSRCFNFSSTYCWKETRISRLFSTELPSTVVLKVQRERSGSLSALSSPPWIIWSLSKTRLEKLGWPWRWPLFVDLILAASKHFPSPISIFELQHHHLLRCLEKTTVREFFFLHLLFNYLPHPRYSHIYIYIFVVTQWYLEQNILVKIYRRCDKSPPIINRFSRQRKAPIKTASFTTRRARFCPSVEFITLSK